MGVSVGEWWKQKPEVSGKLEPLTEWREIATRDFSICKGPAIPIVQQNENARNLEQD